MNNKSNISTFKIDDINLKEYCVDCGEKNDYEADFCNFCTKRLCGSLDSIPFLKQIEIKITN